MRFNKISRLITKVAGFLNDAHTLTRFIDGFMVLRNAMGDVFIHLNPIVFFSGCTLWFINLKLHFSGARVL